MHLKNNKIYPKTNYDQTLIRTAPENVTGSMNIKIADNDVKFYIYKMITIHLTCRTYLFKCLGFADTMNLWLSV